MGEDLNFDPEDINIMSFLVRYAINDIENDDDCLFLFYLWHTMFEIDRDETEDTATAQKDKEILDKLTALLVKLDHNNEDSNASDNS